MSSDEIDSLASAIFDTMLEDVVLGIALDEHKAGMRNRAVCAVCHTRCRLEEHINQGANSGLPGTPNSGNTAINGDTNGSVNGNGNGTKGESAPMADCIKCRRTIVSTRYAQHLAACMGLGNARRTGPRNAASKARTSTDSGPATPTQRSGSVNSEEAPAPTSTAKPKASKKKKKPDASTSDTTNENNKREGAAPAKTAKQKKQKVGKAANGKPLAFQPSNLEEFATASIASPSPGKPSSTVSRVPSKLQNSQTPISPSNSSTTTPTHTPKISSATVPLATGSSAPPRMVRGTGPPRPLLGRGPSVPRTSGVAVEKPHPPVPTRQSSGRTEVDGDDDLVDTASDSSDDT
ncbi:unnamed protein product [Rhizoctonia solani]|uniref:SAGA-associated factor 11 n=1 Tax=Rhizoctonia solani TaxID=456999 RepID=A0A8H2WUC7_9AGAM|nr:unnamed protein product [Rhizoctonia solani]CAE6527446.1 unnamed protein product [Rhizoctonia solani]